MNRVLRFGALIGCLASGLGGVRALDNCFEPIGQRSLFSVEQWRIGIESGLNLLNIQKISYGQQCGGKFPGFNQQGSDSSGLAHSNDLTPQGAETPVQRKTAETA